MQSNLETIYGIYILVLFATFFLLAAVTYKPHGWGYAGIYFFTLAMSSLLWPVFWLVIAAQLILKLLARLPWKTARPTGRSTR